MTRNNLKPQHQDSVIGQMLGLKAQITYHNDNIVPFYNEMKVWEKKEYDNVNNNNINKLAELKQYTIENESLFNLILIDYNMSVAIFINKYILN